jgi:sulfide dehydrogenase cytochrome subunit
MRSCTIAILSVLAAGATGVLVAQEASCEGCHGPGGVSVQATIPSIAGISPGVHADALLMYQEGALPCAGSPMRVAMCASVAGMSEARIEELAEYYAAQAFVPAKQAFDADQANAGLAVHQQSCELCHSRGGSDPEDDASILAGQWMPYLRLVMEEYARGEREQSPVMAGMIQQLTAEQIEALLHYYASQQ